MATLSAALADGSAAAAFADPDASLAAETGHRRCSASRSSTG